MNGFIPHRIRRGSCIIQCRSPSLWPFVAQALGFTVRALHTPCQEYKAFLERCCPIEPTEFSAEKGDLLRVIFSDWDSLQLDDSDYWIQSSLPHVFTMGESSVGNVPTGWCVRQHSFSHAQLGGVTDGSFKLGILLRAEASDQVLSADAVPPLPRQAPSTLGNILKSTVHALAYKEEDCCRRLATAGKPSASPVFIRHLLSPHGLAPSDRLHTVRVIAPCVYSPTGWGTRRLELEEIAGARDVPILFQDALLCNGDSGTKVLRDLCSDHPGKVLHLGADFLLGVYCRGGLGGIEVEGKVPLSTGPCAMIQQIKQAAQIAARHEECTTTLDTVVKQEGQKADDAAVPVHLWDAMWLLRRSQCGLPPLEDGWGKPFAQEELSGLPRWRWSLQRIRDKMFIVLYRRRVMRSFCEYARRFMRQSSSVCLRGGVVWWSRRRHGYEWTPNGRHMYKEMWLRQRPTEVISSTMESGREAVTRAIQSTWWDWDCGSSLFFWRWPVSHLTWARVGQPHLLTAELPRFKRAQRKPTTELALELVRAKVNKVRRRLYIAVGRVLSLTHMFHVPKPPDDIRMVYDGTASGLNDALYSPHFSLPVVGNTLRSLMENYFAADLDVGEMFLNWPLGEELREYAGVDITHVQTSVELREEWEQGRNRPWERWVRNFMGLKDSPYRSMQLMIKAKYIAYGDRTDDANPFQWETVVLNLPGNKDYDPTLPWVMKVRQDGHLACEVYIYVDDGRFTGWCKMECWKAVQKFSSVLTFLGIQDAYRKRTEPLTEPGPWAGTVTTTSGGVFATVTAKKWRKTSEVVLEMVEMMRKASGAMPRKRLEQIRGFLIYVGRTYRWMNPYLKGLHLTIDSWREDRDEDGYRMRNRPLAHAEVALKAAEGAFDRGELDNLEGFEGSEEDEESEAPPNTVRAANRLADDLQALVELTAGEEPAVQKCRVKGALAALYLMGDASGKGFGSGVWDEKGLAFKAGSWKSEFSKESSNWREAANLTQQVEELGKRGQLKDKELFIFTDNSTFEGTFYKGYSKSSKKLTRIIFRLRKLERETGCILHVIHISGTRMKAAGVDGLSRCDFMEGIMAGKSPWDYVPLNEDADQRTGGRVTEWVQQWWHDEKGEPWCQPLEKESDRGSEYYKNTSRRYESSSLVRLEPKDWFSLHEIHGHRLWVPPPAAMETVMELFAEDHLVNPHLAHVFVVPRLMTHLWRKHLFKDADLNFYVQAGAPFWPRSMHEPLTVVLVFPLAHVQNYRGPWTIKGKLSTEAFAKQLDVEYKRLSSCGRKEFLDLEEPMPNLREDAHRWTWNLLRQFLHEQRNFPPVRSGILRGVLPGLRGGAISNPEDGGRRRRRRKRVRGG